MVSVSPLVDMELSASQRDCSSEQLAAGGKLVSMLRKMRQMTCSYCVEFCNHDHKGFECSNDAFDPPALSDYYEPPLEDSEAEEEH